MTSQTLDEINGEGAPAGQATSTQQKTRLQQAYMAIIRILIGGLMLILGLWIVSGIFSLSQDLWKATLGDWETAAEHMIMKVIIILAVLELLRTLYSYMETGRVRVTFILDAALVVLIGELIGLWYREHSITEVLLSLGVISLLVLLRMITMKYSPAQVKQLW